MGFHAPQEAARVGPSRERALRRRGLPTYGINMKAIQITVDAKLLAQLDADEEVQRDGRSAVLRRAAMEYLRRKQRASIADAYRKGYRGGVERELAGWGDEGEWPEE